MVKQTIWEFLIDSLERYRRAALLIVVDSKGSSPGTAGAKMALAPNGSSFGTIGGGSVEYELTQLSRDLLDDAIEPAIRLFNRYHNEHKAEASGHICGGSQQVVLWLCRADDLPVLEMLQQRLEERQPMLFSVTPKGVETVTSPQQSLQNGFSYRHDEQWRYQEPVGLSKQAYIVGGGHVSLALSQLLTLLDFEISVFDQRDRVATMVNNPYARDTVVAPYQSIDALIPEGDNSYVFVMTHSHETDQLVIERLAGKDYRYLGLIGSDRKINIIKKNLANRLSPHVWDNIRAPLGLPINSKTPMEIAVSITAELIQFENA